MQRLQERDADVARALARADTAVQALAAAEAAAAATAGSEAVLRRLDNERQYLRSQLESELTCKSELQEALDRAQRQLHDVKLGWQRDQDRLFQVRAFILLLLLSYELLNMVTTAVDVSCCLTLVLLALLVVALVGAM
jgi:hypothetical protein